MAKRKTVLLWISRDAFQSELSQNTRRILRKLCVVCKKDTHPDSVKLTFKGVRVSKTTNDDFRIETGRRRQRHIIIPRRFVMESSL
ncbi:MAG: hypothetical protein Q7S53_02825 [bacterium]|nr:hypothetical protein [bacterium]